MSEEDCKLRTQNGLSAGSGSGQASEARKTPQPRPLPHDLHPEPLPQQTSAAPAPPLRSLRLVKRRDPRPAAPPPPLEVVDRHLVLVVPQQARGGLPAPPLGLVPAPRAHALPQLPRVVQPPDPLGVPADVAGLHEVARVAVSDQVGYPPRTASHDRYAGRHALQDHEPERLRVGRHHEAVGRREGAGQVVPAQLAGEDGPVPVEQGAEAGLLRTLPHHAEADVVGELVHHLLDLRQALLGPEPSDVSQEEVPLVRVFRHHPRPTELVRPVPGMEPLYVDPLPPDSHAGYAVIPKLLSELRTRRQRQVGEAVYDPQGEPRGRLEEAEAVGPRVHRQVGVVAHDERHRVTPGVVDRREEEEARRDGVDEVRPPPLEQPRPHAVRHVEGQAEGLVEGEGEAARVVDRVSRHLLGKVLERLGRVDGRRQYVDLVAREAEAAEHLLEAVGVA
ncbi:hypothetical protein THAOC_37400 [Thalassiosira oceanica]|uniref:Uncharacterized protein n=1 Tax=Thalassiosira oceanica TaxID=159749 RepID=K0RC40_THAOC|nr:hypothetical protein THAOC_37400 [Thalassiosira oceanica]|eukprot:EJK44092.1 hypothetical protein THAOC_37400 [Thalassiosira oceanica]